MYARIQGLDSVLAPVCLVWPRCINPVMFTFYVATVASTGRQ